MTTYGNVWYVCVCSCTKFIMINKKHDESLYCKFYHLYFTNLHVVIIFNFMIQLCMKSTYKILVGFIAIMSLETIVLTQIAMLMMIVVLFSEPPWTFNIQCSELNAQGILCTHVVFFKEFLDILFFLLFCNGKYGYGKLLKIRMIKMKVI